MRTESILEKLYYSYKMIQETRTRRNKLSRNRSRTRSGPSRVRIRFLPTVSSAHIEHTCSSCRSSNYPSYFQKARFHCTFVNWRNSTVLSPIYSHDFHQLAKFHCTFANNSLDFRHWRKSYWRKSNWRNSSNPNTSLIEIETYLYKCQSLTRN